MPLELRFDIPFGVSPKVHCYSNKTNCLYNSYTHVSKLWSHTFTQILDPVNPSQQLPLPLHLAESGRVRLRPQGNSYVWSEAHNLQTVLSQGSKSGFLRSFVCYPSHLRGDPFRCCISVKRISLLSFAKSKNGEFIILPIVQSPNRSFDKTNVLSLVPEFSKRFLYQLALSTPLVIHNYLPETVSLIIECGGVKHPTLLSEVCDLLS